MTPRKYHARAAQPAPGQPWRKTLSCLAAAGLCLTALDTAQAGHAKFTFEEDPLGVLDVMNNAQWMTSGGNPGGYLEITSSVGNLKGVVFFDDFDSGAVVSAFTFTCDLKIGDGTADPADGFSVNYARDNDPVITAHDGNGFAGINAETNLPEEGTQTGLGIGFDAWNSGGVDFIGISVRVDNTIVAQIPMPTKNGAPTDATSLQTGPRDTVNPGSGSLLTWQPLKVQLSEDAKLNIWWKGTQIVTNLQTTYFPSKGRLVFAGRTGGSFQMQAVDNIEITTVTPTADTEPPTPPTNFKVAEAGAGRVLLTWGASTDNSGRVSYQLERNGTRLPNLITAAQFEDRGVRPKTAYTYKLTASDLTGNASPAVSVSTTTVDDAAVAGTIKGEIFDGITGTTIQNLLDDPKFQANTPDRVVYLTATSFGEWTSFGETYGDNYGMRITGVLTAPETAQYDFFIRSDDSSSLFLNRQGATLPDPVMDNPIVQETDCCDAFVEPATFNDDGVTSATTEAPISLQAGQQYGFVILMKEGGGGDYCQVAWRKVGDTTPAANLQPISGAVLSGRGDPAFSSVTITQPPQDSTIVANERATFTVKAEAKSPYSTNVYYQWYKNGAMIAGAMASTYILPVVAASDAAQYTVLVNANGASATSSAATLNVTTDTKPATIAAVSGDDSFTAVTVSFSEPVKAPTATTPANYSLSGGLTVSAAALADAFTVKLTTSKQSPNTEYTLTVNNVQDNAGNAVAANSQAKFSSWILAANRSKMEQWNGITLTAVQNLLDDPKYQGQPDTVRFLQGLSTGTNTAENFGDNYGARITAFLIPTETAQYDFFIRSDDASQLYLSQSETFPVPGTDAPLIEETGCCKAFLEPNNDTEATVTTAQPISLVAGKKYAVLVLMKEGTGGDFVQVAWRKAGNATLAADLTPITQEIWYYAPPTPVTTVSKLAIAKDATGKMVLTFEGTLQSATSVLGPFTDVPGASPLTVTPDSVQSFYRARN